jgi:hypothetical protein
MSLDGFMQLPQSPPPLVTKQPRKDYVAVRVWKTDGTFEAAFYSKFDMRYFIDKECDDEKLAYTFNEIFDDDEHPKDVSFSADVWCKNKEVRRFLLLLLEDAKYFDLEDFIEEEYDENDVHGIGMQRHFTYPRHATHVINLFAKNWERVTQNPIKKWVQRMVYNADKSDSELSVPEDDVYTDEVEEVSVLASE